AGTYARVDDLPGVVVLDEPAVKELRKTYLDFVSRKVLEDFDPNAVAKMQTVQGPSEVRVEKRDDTWHLTLPMEQKADDQTINDLLRQLAALRARRVAAYSAKKLEEKALKEFG